MSLEGLTVGLSARICRQASGDDTLETFQAALLQAELRLTYIHLSDQICDPERNIAVPHLPYLEEKVGVDELRLRTLLDELIADGLISACKKHPLDGLAKTEGFVLHLDTAPQLKRIESPWAAELRHRA